jgi:rhodanese-related sulfurtransferase
MNRLKTVSVKRLAELESSGNVDVIDVRTPVEFREVHAAFARNVPLESLDPQAVMKIRNGSAEDSLYVMCGSGNRSSKACQKFIEAGYSNVVNVEGGVQAWVQAGLPAVRGQKAVSLERQVRIAAGLLVLIGALLSYFAHPFWTALPAIVGAGLVFAGITDTCGMGMLLAKLPWNQVCKGNATPVNSANCGVGGCK